MSEADDARNRIRDELGSAFAEKASDALCLAVARRAAAAEVVAADARTAASVIVEFDPVPGLFETAGSILSQATRAGVAEQIDKATAGVGPEAIGEEAPRAAGRSMLRQRLVAQLRDHFLRSVGPTRDQIERATAAVASTLPESHEASSITELCWLNRTMRVRSASAVLAEIASDPGVHRFDLPRILQADLVVSASTVGAPEFRSTNGVDGRGVIVAVIDSEVARAHPGFQTRVVHQANFTKETWGNPDGHGTAVAGIVAGDPGDPRFRGIAPAATVYNYKVLATSVLLNADHFGGSLAIQQALEDGAMIANCSWGAGPAGDGTSPEARACNAAWQLGMVVVKSAGNKGPGASTLTTPADAEGVIVVGATDRPGTRLQDYSSRGPTRDGRARPHLLAPGGSFVEPMESLLVGGGIGSVGVGTSYAAPHVSGAVALLLHQDPNLEPDAVRARLLASCRPLAGVSAALQGAGVLRL